MGKKRLKLGIVILLILGFSELQAQEVDQRATIATGGEASGSGGTVSYTVGQLVYSSNMANNGSVSEGVQQPFEISVVAGLTEIDITCEISVYPNPASENLILNIFGDIPENFNFSLFDFNGKLINRQQISAKETKIGVEYLHYGIYFIKVATGRKEIKTFKIIIN